MAARRLPRHDRCVRAYDVGRIRPRLHRIDTCPGGRSARRFRYRGLADRDAVEIAAQVLDTRCAHHRTRNHTTSSSRIATTSRSTSSTSVSPSSTARTPLTAVGDVPGTLAYRRNGSDSTASNVWSVGNLWETFGERHVLGMRLRRSRSRRGAPSERRGSAASRHRRRCRAGSGCPSPEHLRYSPQIWEGVPQGPRRSGGARARRACARRGRRRRHGELQCALTALSHWSRRRSCPSGHLRSSPRSVGWPLPVRVDQPRTASPWRSQPPVPIGN